MPVQGPASPRPGLCRALAAILVASAHLVAAARPRALLASKDVIEGKAVVLSTDWPGERSEKSLIVIRQSDGRKVKILAADPSIVKGVRTGQRVQAGGEYDAAAPNGNAYGRFKADIVIGGSGAASPEPVEGPWVGPTEPADMNQYLPGGALSDDVVPADGGRRLLAAPRGRRLQQVASGDPYSSYNPLATAAMRTMFVPLVARVNGSSSSLCAGTGANPFTAAQLKSFVFQETNTSAFTVGRLFNQCSFNQTQLTDDNSVVVNPVVLPCTGNTYGSNWNVSTCNFDDFAGMADAADQILISRGLNVASFPYRVYYLPPGPCTWVGQGYIGCDGSYDCRAWVSGGFWDDPQVAAHELGHNLFMQHASYMGPTGATDEYGDGTCTMGGCCDDRCLNGAHAWQMGWTTVRQFNGTNMPAATSYTGMMGFGSVSPGLSTIRVVPTWAPTVDPVFVSYRWAVRGDAGLALSLSNRVHIYTSAISGSRTPEYTYLRATLTINTTYVLSAANLVITRLSNDASNRAYVTICRRGGLFETSSSCRNGVDWNCDGLAGADDPACQAYL